jgi:MFS family permease
MVVYSLATLACGLAQSMGQLIVLRGVQGIGGAMVFGNSLAIVTNAFPAYQRGRAVGALATVSSLGAMLVTVLGASMVQYATWRWTFYLVLPIAVVGAYLAFALGRLNRFSPAGITSAGECFDFISGVWLFAALSALLLGLSHLHGGEPSFSSGRLYHLTLLALSFYCLITFLVAERRAANPLRGVLFREFAKILGEWWRIRTGHAADKYAKIGPCPTEVDKLSVIALRDFCSYAAGNCDEDAQVLIREMQAETRALLERMDQRVDERQREVVLAIQALWA